MHNIKDIRKDFNNFKEKLKNRNIDTDLDNIISLDEQNRKLIQEKETLEMEKKTISKSKDQKLFEKSKNSPPSQTSKPYYRTGTAATETH